MALTDSKTGFRLPWSTDRSASHEAPAEPAETDAVDPATSATPEATTTTQDAPGDAVRSDEEDLVTTYAPDMAATPVHAETAPHPWASGTPASEPAAAEHVAPAPLAPAQEPARRPTKFLADLTRAMQVAAEQARTATIEQFHADGTAVIEEIHARTASSADELRRRADEDVVAIKDWSKAEIARIREETERRVAGRREQLEGQLERHAALVEHEIETVRGRIASFEEEMGRFFDDLLREEDPAEFAARAASLPEPPPFPPLDDDALEAILAEPGQGLPEPVVAEPEPEPEPVVEAAVEAVVEPTVDEAVSLEPAEPFDREAAMAAIQAAAEAAAAAEVAEPVAEAAVEVEAAEEVDVVADSSEARVAEADPAGPAESLGSWWPTDAEPATGQDPATETAGEPELDPRLAMLGLTPDFAAAEVAAAEAAAAEVEEIPEVGGDELAARLSGLVPDDAPAEPVQNVTTQVVTTGLVSVASIASFKRHLGRLPGVAHVGVSSGPDGEFVFAVQHDPATALAELIPTVPGFGARVASSGEGVLQISAQDPQD